MRGDPKIPPAGRRPSGDVLPRLADALGVTITDIMGASQPPSEGDPRYSESLQEFAADEELPEADLKMLAGIKWRGSGPRTKERCALFPIKEIFELGSWIIDI